MIDVAAVTAATDEVAGAIRADGGDLVVMRADPATDVVELQLVLDDVSCLDCVLPPETLRDVVATSIGRHVRGEFELVLHDPRLDDG
jgi:Fe-S cluster biogenesis protein NfuA